jgi:hypothetical protein
MKTKIFFDCEFTGLSKHSNLISIGMVAETGHTFYAEIKLNDELRSQSGEWIEQNVFPNLTLQNKLVDTKLISIDLSAKDLDTAVLCSDTDKLQGFFNDWIDECGFGDVVMVGDCLAYDWVLFCDLFGGALRLPHDIYYIPLDLSTMFFCAGIHPDVSRETFAYGEHYSDMPKHNALWDARVIKACYDKLAPKFKLYDF